MSGNDFLNKNVLRWRWKVDRDVAEVISSGSWFHVWGPETENARLPIADSLTAGTDWWLQSAKPVGQAGQRHGQMVPDIAVPHHSWLCRSAQRPCTLCALVSAASGDRPVHQWCDQKTSDSVLSKMLVRFVQFEFRSIRVSNFEQFCSVCARCHIVETKFVRLNVEFNATKPDPLRRPFRLCFASPLGDVTESLFPISNNICHNDDNAKPFSSSSTCRCKERRLIFNCFLESFFPYTVDTRRT